MAEKKAAKTTKGTAPSATQRGPISGNYLLTSMIRCPACGGDGARKNPRYRRFSTVLGGTHTARLQETCAAPAIDREVLGRVLACWHQLRPATRGSTRQWLGSRGVSRGASHDLNTEPSGGRSKRLRPGLSVLAATRSRCSSSGARRLTALAATFTVTQTTDAVDANVGDGIRDVDTATPGNQCSLRGPSRRRTAWAVARSSACRPVPTR